MVQNTTNSFSTVEFFVTYPLKIFKLFIHSATFMTFSLDIT